MQAPALAGSPDGQGGTAATTERMSRCDILNIVRKHSDALPRPSGAPELPAARARDGGATPAAPGPPRPWATTGPKGGGAAASAWRGDEDSPRPSSARDLSRSALPGSSAESPAAVMDPRYWKEMLSMYFVSDGLEGTGVPRGALPAESPGATPHGPAGTGASSPGSAGSVGERDSPGTGLGIELQAAPSLQHKREALFDDMLFFVRQERSALGQILNFFGSLMSDAERSEEVQEKAKPYFVRRWGSDLDKVVGESAGDVDWRRSYYLNLICHTEYSLTVAICRRQDLENHRRSHKAPVPPLYKVTKRVYASPSKARIDMDTSKAQETLPSFPDICFAVDDYDNTFEAVVLEHPDHCFCVLLNAYGGAAFPPEGTTSEDGSCASSRAHILTRGTSSEARALGEAQAGVPKITLFSGFVSYPMVRAAFQGGGASGFSLFGSSTVPAARAEKLVMRGPGGRGEAEVAVMGVTVPSCTGNGTAEGSSASDLAGGRRPAAMNGSPGGRKASLEELQAKLWSVQQQLMAVIQQQQQLQQQSPSETGSSGDMPSASGLGPDRKTAEEEKQRQLQQLQEELKDVQEQLQRVQKGSPNRGASPQPGPADHPGSLQGSRAAQSPLSHRSGATPGPPQSGANAPSPGAPQGGASTPSPGASSSGQGPRKRASGAPPRRAMVHHEEPQGTAGPSAGSGAGKAGVTRHKAQMQQQEHVQPLRCCLMSLSLPWDLLAFDLLFKEMPIKVDIGGRVYPPKRP